MPSPPPTPVTPSPSLTLWIDIATGKLLSGWQSISYAPNPTLKQGDLLGVEVHLIKNFLGGSFSEYEFSPSSAVTLAIGRIDTAPDSGTFKLVYDGDETSQLTAGASASAVQTALNALASITAEGGVVVSKIGNSYRIVWNNTTASPSTLTSSDNQLYPSSTINSSLIRLGSATERQIYQVHIKQSPVANITSFVNQTSPTLSVSQIHAPAFVGDTKVWRVSISPQPKSGSILISFNSGSNTYTTNAIDINASGDTVLSALNSTLSASWSVVKSGVNQWDIATTDSAVFNLTATESGIIAFNSKYGILDLDTAEVEDLLAGESSADAYMELQVETGGVKHTILQQQVTILNDLIDDANYTLVNWGDVVPADKVVRFDTAQSLTTSEQLQARQNIGVSDIDTSSLTAKDVELEGRIGDLESVSLSTNQFDAIDNSDNPSSTNVVITNSALSTALTSKADNVHTHTITDITNLATQLSGKASSVHTHSISDITNLSTELASKETTANVATLIAGKADVSHTHTTLSQCYIGLLDSPQISGVNTIFWGLGSAIDSLNQNGITFNSGATIGMIGDAVTATGTYDKEIPIVINGIEYRIPCRQV